MLKRLLPFFFSLSIGVMIVFKYFEINLFYFVAFPLLLFPILYYLRALDKLFFIFSSMITLMVFMIHLPHHTFFENLLLSGASALLVSGFYFYQHSWMTQLRQITDSSSTTLHELDSLKNKHAARLENLHHLENQVSGLLDLFEIARDFSEVLSFDSVADILGKIVLPELPFSHLRLIVQERKPDGTIQPRTYSISSQGVQKTETELSSQELTALIYINPKDSARNPNEPWIFSLLKDDRISAAMIVEGAESQDLPKFEVLCAYLPLQLKKIRLYEEVKDLSIRDGLTGVFVRRHFIDRFEEELRRSIKYQHRLAVLMLDIDHFKRYNDDYGHLAGDETLKEVAKVLCDSLRKVDIVARYGGEEFIVVIPETKKEGAIEVAERIRSNIARTNYRIFSENTRVTASIGLSLFAAGEPGDEKLANDNEISEFALELIRRADKALYHAKEEGRNQVVLFDDL